jgi:hypothetical protein
MTALEEMGIVMRAVPGPRAGVCEVADWYNLKAHLLDRLAGDTAGTEAERMRTQAVLARRRAAKLLMDRGVTMVPQNKVGGLAASNGS